MRNRYSSTIKISSLQLKQAALYSQLLAEHARPQKLTFIWAELALCCSRYPQHWKNTKTIANFYIFAEIHTFLIGAAADHTQPYIFQTHFLLLPLSRHSGSNDPKVLNLVLHQSRGGFEFFPAMKEIDMSIEYTEIQQFGYFYFKFMDVGVDGCDQFQSSWFGGDINEEFDVPVVSLLHCNRNKNQGYSKFYLQQKDRRRRVDGEINN